MEEPCVFKQQTTISTGELRNTQVSVSSMTGTQSNDTAAQWYLPTSLLACCSFSLRICSRDFMPKLKCSSYSPSSCGWKAMAETDGLLLVKPGAQYTVVRMLLSFKRTVVRILLHQFQSSIRQVCLFYFVQL